MPEIQIRFATKKGFLSKLIRLISSGPFSHVDVILPDGMAFGSSAHGGVMKRDPDYVKIQNEVIATISVSLRQEKLFYDFLFSKEGCRYDELAFWAFVSGRAFHEEDAWTCSELPVRALEIARVFPRPLYFPASRISPTALCLAISVLPNAKFQRGIL